MNKQSINPATSTVRLSSALDSTSPTKPRTGRQRQVDELYDLYDMVIVERLLKRHPSLNKLSGA